jgi:hypothetical protein
MQPMQRESENLRFLFPREEAEKPIEGYRVAKEFGSRAIEV